MTSAYRYNAEWAELVDAVRLAWTEPEFDGCHRLDQVLERVRAEPDAVLRALVRRAQAGDGLAGRAVLQALLGKLVLMAGRDRGATLDDYCAELWCVLMRYPIERRRGSVAGGLVLDTLKRVVAQRTPGPVELPAAVVAEEVEPGAEDVIREAWSLGLIDVLTARLLYEVYVAGASSAQAAASRAVTPAAVRHRCRTAIRRLAEHRELLVA